MSIFAEKRAGVLTGRWVAEVMVDGKTTKRRADTKKEAKELEAKIRAGLIETGKAPKAYLVADLLRDTVGLWAGTKDERNSLRKLDKVCGLLGHETALRDITATLIDTLQASLRAEGLSDRTINRYNATLSKILEWACERDHITKVPVIRWFDEPITKFAWVEPEQEKALITWLENPENVRDSVGLKVSLAVQVLTLTGMRVGELVKLEASHIDPDRETVTLWETKNGDNRTQYLPKELAVRLKALKRSNSFPSYAGIQGVFYRARMALGLPETITLHTLRHTTATRLAKQGVNQKIIMDYMGHKSVSTTNRYTHVDTATKKTAAMALIEMTRGV